MISVKRDSVVVLVNVLSLALVFALVATNKITGTQALGFFSGLLLPTVFTTRGRAEEAVSLQPSAVSPTGTKKVEAEDRDRIDVVVSPPEDAAAVEPPKKDEPS